MANPVTNSKHIRIREMFTGELSPKYDVDKCELYDAKIWGQNSKNGFHTPTDILREALGIANNSISFIDHDNISGQTTQRSVGGIFGKLKETYIDSAGDMRAKVFRWNPNHQEAKNFVWTLQNAPEKIGFSVAADGAVGLDQQTGKRRLTKIHKVDSFDIVYRPANTGSILEQETTMDETFEGQCGMLANSITKDTSMTMDDKKKKLVALLKMRHSTAETVSAEKTEYNPETDMEAAVKEAEKYSNPLIRCLVAGHKGYKFREQCNERLELAKKTIPTVGLTDGFKEMLFSAKDAETVNVRIREQATLIAGLQTLPTTAVGTGTTVKVLESEGTPAKKPFDLKAVKETVFGGK